MNYPTVREQGLLSAALKQAADLFGTLTSAKIRGWHIDRTELLNYILAETDHLNDTVLGLVQAQVKED